MSYRKNISILLLVAATLFSNYSIAQHSGNNGQIFQKKNNEVIYKGNKFTLASKDDVRIMDSILSPSHQMVPVPSTRRSKVVSMNGQKIYDVSEVKVALRDSLTYNRLGHYLLSQFLNEPRFKSLPDGTVRFTLNDIIIDTTGKIVYYNLGHIFYTSDKGDQKRILDIHEAEMDIPFEMAPHVPPGTLNGKKIIANLNTLIADYTLEIKNHVVTYTNTPAKTKK